MTFATIVDNFLRGDYPFPMMLFTVIIASVIVVFLSKHLLGKLNIATKTDITQLREEMKQQREETKGEIANLREETKSEIANLHEEMKNGFQQLKENDLYHTNKAMLIMAKALISDQNVYERIKDAIIENTPDRLKDDIRNV